MKKLLVLFICFSFTALLFSGCLEEDADKIILGNAKTSDEITENVTLVVNDSVVEFKEDIIVDQGVIFVSLNDFCDIFGAAYSFIDDNILTIVTNGKYQLTFKIGSNFYNVTKLETKITTKQKASSPIMKNNDKVYIPIIEISKVLGYKSNYDVAESIIYISK